jgi:methylmalonic aciduria homocystinuria type C protein
MDLASLQADLAAGGVDVVHKLNATWYNTCIATAELGLSPLPTFGHKNGPLVLLLGNTKAVWPLFLTWLGKQPDIENTVDPFDTYISSVIVPAVATHINRDHEIFYPWEGGERLVSMQRVAVAGALCYLDNDTHLAIHPQFGAWVAFRAVLVLDFPASDLGDVPSKLGCLLSDEEKAAARMAMAAALQVSDEANLCTQLHGANGIKTDVRMAWAALRDCVKTGREYRYSEAQLNYHYTKDKAVLLQASHEHAQQR